MNTRPPTVPLSAASPSAAGNSRRVTSAQTAIHRELARLLQRHVAHPFLRPIGEVSRQALIGALAKRDGRPLILDSCCGVGESSRHIASRFPQAFVLGVDKSEARLQKASDRDTPANLALIRADIVDVWRLLADAGERLARHYLLYPNPWPKIGHIGRRWHGHAVFPQLLALGGEIELRSNWRIYLDEFAFAVEQLTGQTMPVEPFVPDTPMTPFERKYHASGQPLYRASLCLGEPRKLNPA